MFNILFGFVGGGLLPLQTGINTNLKNRVGTPFLASLVSFAVGTVFLALLIIIRFRSLAIPFSAAAVEPFWIWLGGRLGVIYLTGNILLMPKLGSVQTVVFPVFGLIITGVLIDSFGLFESAYKPLTWSRILGACLALLGVILITVAKNKANKGTKKETDRSIWLWRLLGICTGSFSAMQIAINGHLGRVMDAPLKAALISFVVGTLSMFIFVLITRQKITKKSELTEKFPWWIWIGGTLGAIYVFATATISPILGTGLVVVISLTGQMTSSILVDQFGLFRMKKNPVSILSILGLCAMIAGACMIQLIQ